MGLANYASTSDVALYLPGLDTSANGGILTVLENSASRFIDHKTGQFFYDEGASTKYFDALDNNLQMAGRRIIMTSQPFFTITAIKLAYFENQDPTLWLTLTGDGVTPPSNYYLWPSNPRNAGSAASPTALKPYWGFDLAFIPSSATSFLPTATGGHKTISVNAHWGWPAVPDVIKDLTCKMVVRAFRAREAGHAIEVGTPELGGVIDMSRFFDDKDMVMLTESDLVAVHL